MIKKLRIRKAPIWMALIRMLRMRCEGCFGEVAIMIEIEKRENACSGILLGSEVSLGIPSGIASEVEAVVPYFDFGHNDVCPVLGLGS